MGKLIRLSAFAIAAYAFVAGSAGAENTVKHGAMLKPVKGGKVEFLDPKSVDLRTDGKAFQITIDVGHDIPSYIEANGSNSVVKILLDTDLNPGTGGKPFGRDETGFDFSIESLYACRKFEGGHVCAGNIKGRKTTGFYSKYEPKKWLSDKKYFYRIHEAFWKGGKGKLEGSKATVTVPYSEFGVKSGQTIRVLVHQNFALSVALG